MGCDGIWEKKSNEETVDWIYDQIKKYKSADQEINLRQIVTDLLQENLAKESGK